MHLLIFGNVAIIIGLVIMYFFSAGTCVTCLCAWSHGGYVITFFSILPFIFFHRDKVILSNRSFWKNLHRLTKKKFFFEWKNKNILPHFGVKKLTTWLCFLSLIYSLIFIFVSLSCHSPAITGYSPRTRKKCYKDPQIYKDPQSYKDPYTYKGSQIYKSP